MINNTLKKFSSLSLIRKKLLYLKKYYVGMLVKTNFPSKTSSKINVCESKTIEKYTWSRCLISGTIHLRRRQIFTIFYPYSPTIGIPAKCLLMKDIFDHYVLWPLDHWHMGISLPPKTCWRLKWMVPYVSRF